MTTAKPADTVPPSPVEDYRALGLALLPCRAGGKQPLFAGWRDLPAAEQLARAERRGRPYNLAARCGNGLVVVDCEDEETARRAIDWLGMNGLTRCPVVRTPGGGKHLWLRCDDVPAAEAAFHPLTRQVGRGELRCGDGAYVLVPPSVAYSRRAGAARPYTAEEPLELYDELFPLPWSVISVLADLPEALPADGPLEVPVLLPRQAAPPLVEELFEMLRRAPKGVPIPHPRGTRAAYASRSEAEQAILTTLILCGWTKAEILDELERRAPGHLREQLQPERYLERSYRNALAELVRTPERAPLLSAYQYATSAACPLKANLARQVYEYLLALAWREARRDPAISYDGLVAATGASRGGLAAALARLEAQGLVRVWQAENGLLRAEVGLVGDAEKTNISHRGGWSYRLVSRLNRRYRSFVAPLLLRLLLGSPEAGVSAIARRLGVSRDTVSVLLLRLEEDRLVAYTGGRWRVVEEVLFAPQGAAERLTEAHRPLSEAALLRKLWTRGPHFPLPVEGQPPERIYAWVVEQMYGRRIRPERLSPANRQRLAALPERLARLGEASTARYVLWAAWRYRGLVQREGWPYVWTTIVCSEKVMRWYAETVGLLQPTRFSNSAASRAS